MRGRPAKTYREVSPVHDATVDGETVGSFHLRGAARAREFKKQNRNTVRISSLPHKKGSDAPKEDAAVRLCHSGCQNVLTGKWGPRDGKAPLCKNRKAPYGEAPPYREGFTGKARPYTRGRPVLAASRNSSTPVACAGTFQVQLTELLRCD